MPLLRTVDRGLIISIEPSSTGNRQASTTNRMCRIGQIRGLPTREGGYALGPEKQRLDTSFKYIKAMLLPILMSFNGTNGLDKN